MLLFEILDTAETKKLLKMSEVTGSFSAAIVSDVVHDDLLSRLLERIDQAEVRLHSMLRGLNERPVDRVKNDLSRKKVYSSIFVEVSADYYDNSLEARAKILNCSVPQLCKSIIFENTAWCKENDVDDPTNSRYYLVLVQYEGKNAHQC